MGIGLRHRLRFTWFGLLHTILIAGVFAFVAYAAAHRSLQPVVFGRYSVRYFVFLLCSASIAALLASTARKPLYARLYRFRSTLVLCSLASVLFACATLEVAIRTWDIFGISLYDEVERYMRDLVPDPILAYRHQYGLRKTYQGVEVSTNEIGLRDRPLTPKSAAKPRILILGDSVTLGWGVPIEQTFSRRLEVELERRGRPAETVNSGVNGYNTVQELEFLKLRGNLIDPDTVTLMYIENDVDPVITLPSDQASLWQGPLYWFARSRLFRVAYVMIPGYLGYRASPVPGGESWRRSMSALAGIQEYCQSRGIPFVAFLFRLRPTPHTNRLLSDISDLAATNGFKAVDVAPWFAGVELLHVVNSRVDAHPNAAGHQILAKGMAEFFLQDARTRSAAAATLRSPG